MRIITAKKLSKNLRPDLYYSAFWKIDFDKLQQMGIYNLIIDVDSTIAHTDSDDVESEAADALFTALSKGFKICLVSNAITGKCKEKRVAKMAEQFNIPYVAANFFNRKPNSKPFLKGLSFMKAQPKHTAVIGDQIFTDVLGGNRMGMTTILVKPLGPVHWTTVFLLRRYREMRILKKFKIELCD